MDKAERARRQLEPVCREARTPSALLNGVQAALARFVPAERWCALTFDPSTVLPTGGVHEHGVSPDRVPRLLELEFAGDDAIGFAALSREARPVATLAQATGGEHARSARYRDVFAPEGLRHELRAVFRDEAGPWAGLVLLREQGSRDFSADELALVSRVSAQVCQAVRRMLLRAEVEREAHALGPGLLLLDTRAGVSLHYANAAAERWLAEIDDGTAERLPYALYSLALRAATHEKHARTRLRTRAGQWLTAHAEAMSARTVSLILEPSRPHEVAQVLAAAYGLTGRESQVVRLVAAGHSNAEIAQHLAVSRYTVEDHLRHIYEKLSVNTRAALVSKLFFDQYLPRASAGQPLGASGWFRDRG